MCSVELATLLTPDPSPYPPSLLPEVMLEKILFIYPRASRVTRSNVCNVSSDWSFFVIVVHFSVSLIWSDLISMSVSTHPSPQYARDTQHEKIQRGLALGIALVSE